MLRSLLLPFLLLTTASVAMAAPTKPDNSSEKASDPEDKMICKRFVETGSLVKGYRTCKTKREWERDRESVRASTSSGTTCPAGTGPGC